MKIKKYMEKWQSGHFCPCKNVLERSERSKSISEIMDKSIYNDKWFVYIAECRDRTLYTGVAKDVYKRIKEHNTTDKCRYTRFRKPLTLLYSEPCQNYNLARKRESEIKGFGRNKKLKIINEVRSLIPLGGIRDPKNCILSEISRKFFGRSLSHL